MTADAHTSVTSTRLCTDFRLQPDIASRTRNYIVALHRKMLADSDLIDRIAVTIHELTENLTKYARSNSSSLEVVLQVQPDAANVHIRASNVSTPEHLEHLGQMLDRIGSAPDPVRVYDDIIADSLCTPVGSSGLGLARIRAEAGMRLSYKIVGDEVTVEADWSGETRC